MAFLSISVCIYILVSSLPVDSDMRNAQDKCADYYRRRARRVLVVMIMDDLLSKALNLS